ncbi:hypothetical protein CHU95_08880 [Niveispirillum lacus]|uniref:PilZ domain-containing protein n=1 Tax=Niveispirillum lacus TaxID=1981099 RepID=A0A255Z1M1_9PROT|nr:hypothetical protein [Niveispirillum lacus]OYQ35319.1 hypothetical protein CHU95_08880 [Niveispirillum lacus]
MTATAQTQTGPIRSLPGTLSLLRWLGRLWRSRPHSSPPLLGVSVLVNGQKLAVTEVNGSGMCLLGYRGLLNPQDRFSFVLSLGGSDIAGEAIVGWRQAGAMGVAFYDLPGAERDRLGQCLSQRNEKA